jgi:sugar O-acyltransferase (sialic acid O-acetyltransferase NeuD family)
MDQQVVLYGGGGHAKVTLECLQAAGYSVAGFVDDDLDAELLATPHLGIYSSFAKSHCLFVIAIGQNKIRKEIAEKITHSFVSPMHPSSLISPSATIGKGCMILHGAIVQASVVIGNHVIVNTGAQIDHDCHIGDYVHIAPGAILCGNVKLGEGSLIGAGSVVLPEVEIGKWCVVGAGSVVTKSIPDHAVVVGSPAKRKV